MTAENLACVCANWLTVAALGLAESSSQNLLVAMPTPRGIQNQNKNIFGIKCLQKTDNYTVRSSALD